MSLAEIGSRHQQFASRGFARIRDWLLERDSLLWERKIAEDAKSGRFDFLVKEIEGDIADGRTKPLDEVIDGF